MTVIKAFAQLEGALGYSSSCPSLCFKNPAASPSLGASLGVSHSTLECVCLSPSFAVNPGVAL
jgi:hypothetical protein